MFGLINANARLYSPYLGRFVSPDPLLNSEGGAWDYNPYVYANNNPYKYIDRNGEFGLFAIFAAFNAIWNTVHNIKNIIHGGWDGVVLGGLGAVAGALGGWAGPAFASVVGLETSSAISGAVSGAVSGLVSSTTEGLLNALYTHDWSNFSFTNCLMQTASSAVLGGILGGLDAVHDGRSFWHGYKKGHVEISKGYEICGQKYRYDCVDTNCNVMVDGEIDVRGNYERRHNCEADPKKVGINDLEAYQDAAATMQKHAEMGKSFDSQYILDRMLQGDDFGITHWVSGVDDLGNTVEGWHNVLMKKASQTAWFKPNGTMILRKPKLWVMDPAHGGSIHRIYENQLQKVIRVYK